MKAILIDVDFQTGVRAGGINPKDTNLKCKKGWQNLDQGFEIREVVNGNVAAYANKSDVAVLNNADEINAKLVELFTKEDNYVISNEFIMSASINNLNIDFSLLDQTANKEQELQFLYKKGVRGIDKIVNSFDLVTQ